MVFAGKKFLVFLIIGTVFAGIGFAANPGHSISAIDPPAGCSDKYIKYTTAGEWVCDIPAGGSGVWATSGTNIYNTNPGNVGIGISTPQNKFEVAGLMYFSSNAANRNTFIGVNAGGMQADGSVTSRGSQNLFIGYQAGNKNDTGSQNTYVGVASGLSNTLSSYNTALGNRTLESSTGEKNTAIGSAALRNNTTGIENTACGSWALQSNTTGRYNTATGFNALGSNTTGQLNTAVGNSALFNNRTAIQNTAVGHWALGFNTTGEYGTAVGFQALYNNTIGSRNTAMGQNALRENTTGQYNTAIGYGAGYYDDSGDPTHQTWVNTTGSYNTFLGYEAGLGSAAQVTNATAIGKNAIVTASNALVLGGTGANAVNVGIGTSAPGQKLDIIGGSGRVQAGFSWLTNSDLRLKTNVSTLQNSLEKIQNLRGVRYDLVSGPVHSAGNGENIGVIAQEVEKEYPELVSTDSQGMKSVDYGKLAAVLIEAVKEQQKEIDALQKEISELKK